ncbi:MAG: hypothetical protein KZQ85_01230 [Candidatus Thiodiazotropha sp. (ex Myrtea sp. 'scaly one' KF741663)]|nr:hypothetical protein [Candidatus Thiodiazotropha sp. (ex Myrtea sp. 'scaly one' KF741663)]
MKILTQTLLVASLTMFAIVPAFASHGGDGYSKSDRIIERLDRQQRRIAKGIKKDELTRKEVKLLKRDQRDIRQLVRLFRDDGRLSKRERRYLQHRLDRSSQQIKRLKNNDLNRYVRLHERYGQRDYAHRL